MPNVPENYIEMDRTMDISQIEKNILPHDFTSRPLTLDTAGQAVELYNAFSQTYLGINTDSLEDDLVYWQTPGFYLKRDSCVVYDNHGKMVACAEFWDILEPHIRFQVGAVVHPDYENMGIGRYLLAWAEQRAEAALALSPPGARVVLTQGVDARMKTSIAFLMDHGFDKVRDFYHMHIELDCEPAAPVIPDGFQIRPYEGEGERREMIYALWESFKDHWGFVDEPFESYEERWLHWAENMKSMDPTLWFIALKDGETTGGCLCMPARPEDEDMGWINMLGVRRAFRKKGLGHAMLQVAFAELRQRGKKRAGLGVDATNLTGALTLYEKAGMHIAMHQYAFQKVLRDGIELSTQELTA